ncbi:MAG TPA: cupin domain-containing protein [Dehalococcoidia bacterium]|jgi:quercetin dioxygenase-like cupin family protein
MTKDAVKTAPHVYKVLSETDKVRVLEARMKPGDKTELHAHPTHVAVAVTPGKYRFAGADGKSMDAELKVGETMVFEPTEHTSENIGDNEVVAILIEVK